MLKLRKNILSDIKKHSNRKQNHITSLSHSVKKYKKKKNWKKNFKFRNNKHNGKNQSKQKKKDFETFRFCKNKKKSVHSQERSVFDIIQKEQSKTLNTKKSKLKLKLKKKKNYSLLKKNLNLKKKYWSIKPKESNRNNSLHLKHIPKYQSKTPTLKNNSENLTRKSHFKSNNKRNYLKNGIRNKVHREYDLNLIRTREKFKILKMPKKKEMLHKRDTSKDTLKMNTMIKSFHLDFDSKKETMRQQCNSDNNTQPKSTEQINQILWKQLKESQLQNQQFSEVIKELQNQIELLKNTNQNCNFSFKKLSERKFNSNVSSAPEDN
jgi:hypothetical protein